MVGCSEAAALSRPCTEAPRRPARRGGGSRAAPAAARRAASASSVASRHCHNVRLGDYLTLCFTKFSEYDWIPFHPGEDGQTLFSHLPVVTNFQVSNEGIGIAWISLTKICKLCLTSARSKSD